MSGSSLVKTLCCAAVLAALSGAPIMGQGQGAVDRRDAGGFMVASAESLEPAGTAGNTVVLGDPTKPGLYVVRNRFLPGRGSRPHYHDQDRLVTVIKGTWWVHLGPESDTYAPEKMTPVKPGGFVLHPAFGHHYDMAKDEEAIVQIIGMGPVKTTQLEPPGAGRQTAPGQ